MDGGRHLPQALDEVGPVVDEQGPGLGHAQVELVQGVQQGGVLLPVPEYADLMLVEAAILRQASAYLAAAGRCRCPGTAGGWPPLPDEVQILRQKSTVLSTPDSSPADLSRTPLEKSCRRTPRPSRPPG